MSYPDTTLKMGVHAVCVHAVFHYAVFLMDWASVSRGEYDLNSVIIEGYLSGYHISLFD
jgi:hypothetical protein